MGRGLDILSTRFGRPVAATGRPNVTVRPTHKEDHPALAAFYAGLGHDTVRCRFHGAFNSLTPARIREIVALGHGNPLAAQTFVAWHHESGGQVIGHAGWHVDGDDSAELAVVVADAYQGQGLGRRLIDALLESAQARGLRQLQARVKPDNPAMHAVLDGAGFRFQQDPEDPRLLLACIHPGQHRRARWARGMGGAELRTRWSALRMRRWPWARGARQQALSLHRWSAA